MSAGAEFSSAPVAVLDTSVLVPVWTTTAAADARYVISHNTTDFPPPVQGRHVYRGIEYLTTMEFIEDVLGLEVEALYGGPLPAGAIVRSRRARLPSTQLGL
jgi:hypothetical protein